MSKQMHHLNIGNGNFEVVDATARNDVAAATSRIDTLVASRLTIDKMQWSDKYTVADHYNSFKDAWEAATAEKPLWLTPFKTYTLSGFCYNPIGFSVIGNHATIEVGAGGYLAIGLNNALGNTYSGVEISNLAINCNGIGNGLYLSRLLNADIRNIVINEPADYGLKLQAAYGCTLTNILVNNCQKTGIILNYITSNSTKYGANGNAFINCNVEKYNLGATADDSYPALEIMDNCNNNTFINCILEYGNNTVTNGVGVKINDAQANSFYGCWFEANFRHAHIDTGTHTAFDNCKFSSYGSQTQCFIYAENLATVNVINPQTDRNQLLELGGQKSLFIGTTNAYFFINMYTQLVYTGQLILGYLENGTVANGIVNSSVNTVKRGLLINQGRYGNNANISWESDDPVYLGGGGLQYDSTYRALKYKANLAFGNRSSDMFLQPILTSNLGATPSNPVIGMMYFNTSINRPMWYGYDSQWHYADGTLVQ